MSKLSGRPRDIGVIDTLIGFRQPKGTPRDLARVADSLKGKDHPADYMYNDIPEGAADEDDVVADTLSAMDANGVEIGLVSLTSPVAAEAAAGHPDRFVLSTDVDGNDVLGSIRRIRADHDRLGIRAVSMFPPGTDPHIPVDDACWYPIYSTCVELGLPVFCTAGVPGPRVPMDCQHVERFDRVCYDFPDLMIVLRHGAEPWDDLAVKLMLKWPGLHYSTSAFAPKHYPRSIIDYANTRGAEKVLYAGYHPYALTLDRIFTELDDVPLREDVWPMFLRDNAARILGLAAS
jgi:predicted TIM-barrel fold metal-dependent hydrolase